MSLNAHQRHELKKLITELGKYRGRHTELVSVYIPAGYDMNNIINHIAQEAGTASNIKSTSTRKNVEDALTKMMQHLRLYKRTPDHGLAAFSGNVAEREGQSDVRVWSIEPPVPIKTRLYRCDKAFVMEILEDMLNIKEFFGLVVMDRRDATIALLKGKTIVPLVKTHSEVPGKMRAGGQSAQRFEQNRELAAKAHYKKVAEYMKEQFLNLEGLKGIIVGGPGPTKYDLVEGNFITADVKKKIIAIKDVTYTDEFGLQEMLERCDDVFANEEILTERKIMAQFFLLLAKQQNKTSYGLKEVKKRLEQGVVDVLLLSEELDDVTMDELEAVALQFNSKVEIISTETREGQQLRDLGKVAAILRYEVHEG
ncbi:peptide chain release factor aRF-1 [Candidatus Woesearchaeota archaeon]|nr:peptide chain release factor aRF-1 [Candidatus Woesearchaeota archaeon]